MTNQEINEKKWLWQDHYTIASYDADALGYLPFPGLCRFFQETAYNHAHHLEFGYDQLKAQQQSWVLSRLLVKISHYPRWRDQIQVQTWPAGVDGLFAYRHFRVLSATGQILAAASSAWLILDSQKRRPIRPDNLKEKISLFPTELALTEKPTKLPSFSAENPAEPFPVRFSDLDLYDHVNNARYMQWLLDSFPETIHRQMVLTQFEINFVAEAKLGDFVAIHSQPAEPIPHTYNLSIKRLADGKDICLARSTWNNRLP